ncbi:hypothetical protein [Segniliparus rugosus]|uniref:LppI n=1 Tax=Segniliparus rugosus (strain ATCC BAA-974 / DSM 45345 / CCUG 50838 / CIP 108380 / JCM 13579 / CDC 945) TaxID=679197 RepID=E5XRE8_SEGRC|nr:hypothetical protein [Segniliparus rugosus]EFV13081.1 hypothetical protein HMPREF9336_02070 [Segniliparus rugosus ATCC BAA-974]
MRLRHTLVAAVAMALVGCGGPSTEQSQTQTVTSTITSESTFSAPSASPSKSGAPTASGAPSATPPGKGSGFAEIAAWIEAGQAARLSAYQTATGSYATDVAGPTTTTTQSLGDDVAFRSPSKKMSCFGLTSQSTVYSPGGLHCLASLENPPPRPKEMGQWIGGWVEYSGGSASIGSFHGDPGPFTAGDGPELPYGQKISFGQGDERITCRMDQTGLWCANKAKGSAILLNDQGATPYGCLKQIPHKEGEGLSYTC